MAVSGTPARLRTYATSFLALWLRDRRRVHRKLYTILGAWDGGLSSDTQRKENSQQLCTGDILPLDRSLLMGILSIRSRVRRCSASLPTTSATGGWYLTEPLFCQIFARIE